MADTKLVLENLSKTDPFTRKDLEEAIRKCGYTVSSNTVKHMLSRLTNTGKITRVDFGLYSCRAPAPIYNYEYSDLTKKVVSDIALIIPYPDFRIFEFKQLSEFTKSGSADNMIFVSAEKGMARKVYSTLCPKYPGLVMLDPDPEELRRYLPVGMIVIGNLPTESPSGNPFFWQTPLEKMLVDIAIDKHPGSVIGRNEYPDIYKNALGSYSVNWSTIRRYSSRRGAKEKLRRFLLDIAELPAEDIRL